MPSKVKNKEAINNSCTVVGAYINTQKTIFYLSFNCLHAVFQITSLQIIKTKLFKSTIHNGTLDSFVGSSMNYIQDLPRNMTVGE